MMSVVIIIVVTTNSVTALLLACFVFTSHVWIMLMLVFVFLITMFMLVLVVLVLMHVVVVVVVTGIVGMVGTSVSAGSPVVVLDITTLIEVGSAMSVVALGLILGVMPVWELLQFVIAANPVSVFAVEKAWAINESVSVVSVSHDMILGSLIWFAVFVAASTFFITISTLAIVFVVRN